MITLKIIKDIDFYFMNQEIRRLEIKYKKNYTMIKNLNHVKDFDYRKSWKLRMLRSEIDGKKFILSTRYLKKKLPDEMIYEIYKFL